jgi:hypothetical protein
MVEMMSKTECGKIKSDILILTTEPEEEAAEKLSVELELFGADVSVKSLKSFKDLGPQLARVDKNHAMTLLFVTQIFFENMAKVGTKVKNIPASVAIMGFGLKKEQAQILELQLPGTIPTSYKTLESYARGVIEELATPHRAERLKARTSIVTVWKSPLYIFKITAGLDTTDDLEILVDVTWSSKPTRAQMSPALEKSLRATIKHLGKQKLKILDFGAGKLRHTIPLLEKGHSVDAVDYRSLYEKPSHEIKKNLEKVSGFKNKFSQLIYPADFAKSTDQYELILMANVLNIMPEPLERYFVLQKCNQYLSNGGHLLWFCQHGDVDQLNSIKNLKITDGGCTSKKGRKTFYKDYRSRELILRMMGVMGFKHVPLKVDVGKNHALLFQRVQKPCMDVDLVIRTGRKVLGRKVHIGELKSEIAVADVLDGENCIGYGGALTVSLNHISSGKKMAYRYENIMVPIIEYIFQKEFIRATIQSQYEILKGKQRIDIKTEYRESSTLRTTLVNNMRLNSSWIPIECKNYSKPLGNPEYAQIVMRCDKRHRHFGMVFCRDVKNRRKVNEACHYIYSQHEYLIAVFDDSDLMKLLQMADDGNFGHIKNAIVKRVQEVLDLSN